MSVNTWLMQVVLASGFASSYTLIYFIDRSQIIWYFVIRINKNITRQLRLSTLNGQILVLNNIQGFGHAAKDAPASVSFVLIGFCAGSTWTILVWSSFRFFPYYWNMWLLVQYALQLPVSTLEVINCKISGKTSDIFRLNGCSFTRHVKNVYLYRILSDK